MHTHTHTHTIVAESLRCLERLSESHKNSTVGKNAHGRLFTSSVPAFSLLSDLPCSSPFCHDLKMLVHYVNGLSGSVMHNVQNISHDMEYFSICDTRQSASFVCHTAIITSYIFTYVCVCVNMYIYVYICIYMCVYIYTYIQTHVYMCLHICIYTYL